MEGEDLGNPRKRGIIPRALQKISKEMARLHPSIEVRAGCKIRAVNSTLPGYDAARQRNPHASACCPVAIICHELQTAFSLPKRSMDPCCLQ